MIFIPCFFLTYKLCNLEINASISIPCIGLKPPSTNRVSLARRVDKSIRQIKRSAPKTALNSRTLVQQHNRKQQCQLETGQFTLIASGTANHHSLNMARSLCQYSGGINDLRLLEVLVRPPQSRNSNRSREASLFEFKV